MSILGRVAQATDALGLTVPDDAGGHGATPASHGVPGGAQSASSGVAVSVGGSSADYESRIRESVSQGSGAAPLNQFLALADALKEFIPGEVDRYRAAFKQAQATGLTKEAVLSAVSACLSTIDHEQGLFAEAIKQKRASEIDGSRATITELDATIQELRAQLEAAEKERTATQQRIDTATSSIGTAEKAFATGADKLRATYKGLQETLRGLS